MCFWCFYEMREEEVAACCDHPLGRHFCDYEEEGFVDCPLYMPREKEPSLAEEQVRQLLEYTEGADAQATV